MRLVFLHGGAAAGKLTTARELSARLGYPVFHNHLVVDLLAGMFGFGTPAFVRLREEFWLSVFEAAAENDRSLIFTFTPEPTVTRGFATRSRTAIETHLGAVHFVRLRVSDSEQDRRIGNDDRVEFHKLVDREALHKLRQHRSQAEQPPTDLVIDTDNSPAWQTAGRIIDYFHLAPEPASPRYPDVSA